MTPTFCCQHIKAVVLLMLMLLSRSALMAQQNYSITGTVADEKGLTLPGATVFITGTKIITGCDNNGAFRFDKLSPGSYVLAVKMMGFKPFATSVTIVKAPVKKFIKLTPATNSLNTVVIRAEANWEEHYAIFKKHFLGTTPNAANCKIDNPKTLHFHYDKDNQTLSASAEDFIIVDNNALGYRIKYLLSNFEYSERTSVLTYDGYPSFEEKKPKNDKEYQTWQKNRETAYQGSIVHFLKSIYQDKPYAAGYEIFKILNRPLPGEEPDPAKPMYFDRHPVVIDSLVTDGEEGFKRLKFKDCLFVLNYKERVSSQLQNSGYLIEKPVGYKIPSGQLSIIHLVDDNIAIDANGNFEKPGGLVFEGYMAWEQVADLVPLEYGKGDQ